MTPRIGDGCASEDSSVEIKLEDVMGLDVKQEPDNGYDYDQQSLINTQSTSAENDKEKYKTMIELQPKGKKRAVEWDIVAETSVPKSKPKLVCELCDNLEFTHPFDLQSHKNWHQEQHKGEKKADLSRQYIYIKRTKLDKEKEKEKRQHSLGFQNFIHHAIDDSEYTNNEAHGRVIRPKMN